MRKRILVTEDEPEIRLYLRALLEERGFEAIEAADGQAALDRLAAEPVDLMILDLLMPNVDGFEVLSRLTPEQREKLPVVIVTACGSDEALIRGYSLGAAYYITKPYENQQVVDIIRYLFGETNPNGNRLVDRAETGRPDSDADHRGS